ncbi:hypothetical protein [Janthinobacterium agaricidamnosum]|nr:hypothetical protein [Janthinobacterium agaricidamnosum]
MTSLIAFQIIKKDVPEPLKVPKLALIVLRPARPFWRHAGLAINSIVTRITRTGRTGLYLGKKPAPQLRRHPCSQTAVLFTGAPIMPIYLQNQVTANTADISHPGTIRQAHSLALLLSRLRGRLAATTVMATGLVLASLAAALPAQAGPTVKGCADGMICIYADAATFNNLTTNKPMYQVKYEESVAATAELKRQGGATAGKVGVFSLPGMTGKATPRYIFNNSSKQIAYITDVLLKPTHNVTRTIYRTVNGKTVGDISVIGTARTSACRVYKGVNDIEQVVAPQTGKSLPAANAAYTIANSLLKSLAQDAQTDEIDAYYGKDSYIGEVDIEEFVTSVNDVLDTIPKTNPITKADIQAAPGTNSSDQAVVAYEAAVAAILAKNPDNTEKIPGDTGRIIFTRPAAGPSFAGILVANFPPPSIIGTPPLSAPFSAGFSANVEVYPSTGAGVVGIEDTRENALCTALINNKAASD